MFFQWLLICVAMVLSSTRQQEHKNTLIIDYKIDNVSVDTLETVRKNIADYITENCGVPKVGSLLPLPFLVKTSLKNIYQRELTYKEEDSKDGDNSLTLYVYLPLRKSVKLMSKSNFESF